MQVSGDYTDSCIGLGYAALRIEKNLHASVWLLPLCFILELTASNNLYSEKMTYANHSDQEIINLLWKVNELDELNKMGRKLYGNIAQVISRINSSDSVKENIPPQLQDIHKSLFCFIKGLTRHQRITTTHILMLMISGEECRKKPYALPVQCLLYYKELTDLKVCELANRIVQEMLTRQMKVAGKVLHVI